MSRKEFKILKNCDCCGEKSKRKISDNKFKCPKKLSEKWHRQIKSKESFATKKIIKKFP